jgi:hypothetical protein
VRAAQEEVCHPGERRRRRVKRGRGGECANLLDIMEIGLFGSRALSARAVAMGAILARLRVPEAVEGGQRVWRSTRNTFSFSLTVASQLLSVVGIVILSLWVGLLVLFLLHQLTLWVSQDPVTAFHGARVATHYVSSGYDTVALLYNSLRDVVLLAIPVWNSTCHPILPPPSSNYPSDPRRTKHRRRALRRAAHRLRVPRGAQSDVCAST